MTRAGVMIKLDLDRKTCTYLVCEYFFFVLPKNNVQLP